jgi:hypothetical protein
MARLRPSRIFPGSDGASPSRSLQKVRASKDGKGSKLIYLVVFPDREAARKTWKGFSDDPEWKKVYAESHKNGALVNKVESVFLESTDYSAIK